MTVITLLVADSHPYLRESLSRLCELNGFQVVNQAATGAQAIAAARQYQPDVVLIDVDRTDMDGHQVAKSIQQENPAVGIIFLSLIYYREQIQPHPVEKCAYLAKDCNEAVLFATIRKLAAAGDD